MVEQQIPNNDTEPAPVWWLSASVAPLAICNVCPLTGEFLSVSFADPSPLEPGVWLIPANACQGDAPVVAQGYVAVRDEQRGQWRQMADHRGATVYSTRTGLAQVWEQLGDLAEGVTLQAPISEFDVWNGQEWVVDEAAFTGALLKHATRKKSLLTQFSSNKLGTLQYAVDKGIATDDEIRKLDRWQFYALCLDRIEPSPALQSADWPNSPDDDALAAWLESQGYADMPPLIQTDSP